MSSTSSNESINPATAEDVLKARKLHQEHVRAILFGVAAFIVTMTLIISVFALATHVHTVNSHKDEAGVTACIDHGHAGYDAARTSCIG